MSNNQQAIKINIQYCGAWGYGSKAKQAEQIIKSVYPNADVQLQRDMGKTGNFEITCDGKLIHSKKKGEGFVNGIEDIQGKIEASL